MTNWAATTDQIIDNGFGQSRSGSSIQGAIIHHAAGTDALGYVANQNSRNSHPTYHIARDGKATGIVHPDRRPYSTANSVDQIAVTFEIDNEAVGGVWPITDASMEALLQVLLDHGAQSSRTGFAKNIRGQNQTEFFIGYHSQYVATACPGPYITSRIDWIVSELNSRVAGRYTPPASSAPASTPAPAPAPSAPASSGGWAANLPNKASQRRVQKALAGRRPSRYNGPTDGVCGPNTWKGVQTTIRGVGYTGPVDGIPGANTCRLIQVYAARFGDYTGPVDSILGPYSWAGFALGLERP